MSQSDKQPQKDSDRERFMEFFPQIVQNLLKDDLCELEMAGAASRLKEIIEYNVPGGKYTRGLITVAAYRKLAGPEQQDEKSLQRVVVVGWCIELLQAFFLLVDDIIDNSETRRGHLCWHKKEEIGLHAVSDAFFVGTSKYQLLKRYCRDQPYYVNLLELFLLASHQTEIGQTLELVTAPPSQVDLDCFTEQRYKAIVRYKTSIYTFYLPVAVAMYMAGIEDEEQHERAKAVLLEMGELFQVQDDFLDCYGDPSVTGKVGTDIQENKCSWLVVECLKRASPEQRLLLEENYGQQDADKVARVKELYNQLDLQAVYKEFEEDSYQRISALISQHAQQLPSQIFLSILQKIYRRQK